MKSPSPPRRFSHWQTRKRTFDFGHIKATTQEPSNREPATAESRQHKQESVNLSSIYDDQVPGENVAPIHPKSSQVSAKPKHVRKLKLNTSAVENKAIDKPTTSVNGHDLESKSVIVNVKDKIHGARQIPQKSSVPSQSVTIQENGESGSISNSENLKGLPTKGKTNVASNMDTGKSTTDQIPSASDMAKDNLDERTEQLNYEQEISDTKNVRVSQRSRKAHKASVPLVPMTASANDKESASASYSGDETFPNNKSVSDRLYPQESTVSEQDDDGRGMEALETVRTTPRKLSDRLHHQESTASKQDGAGRGMEAPKSVRTSPRKLSNRLHLQESTVSKQDDAVGGMEAPNSVGTFRRKLSDRLHPQESTVSKYDDAGRGMEAPKSVRTSPRKQVTTSTYESSGSGIETEHNRKHKNVNEENDKESHVEGLNKSSVQGGELLPVEGQSEKNSVSVSICQENSDELMSSIRSESHAKSGQINMSSIKDQSNNPTRTKSQIPRKIAYRHSQKNASKRKSPSLSSEETSSPSPAKQLKSMSSLSDKSGVSSKASAKLTSGKQSSQMLENGGGSFQNTSLKKIPSRKRTKKIPQNHSSSGRNNSNIVQNDQNNNTSRVSVDHTPSNSRSLRDRSKLLSSEEMQKKRLYPIEYLPAKMRDSYLEELGSSMTASKKSESRSSTKTDSQSNIPILNKSNNVSRSKRAHQTLSLNVSAIENNKSKHLSSPLRDLNHMHPIRSPDVTKTKYNSILSSENRYYVDMPSVENKPSKQTSASRKKVDKEISSKGKRLNSSRKTNKKNDSSDPGSNSNIENGSVNKSSQSFQNQFVEFSKQSTVSGERADANISSEGKRLKSSRKTNKKSDSPDPGSNSDVENGSVNKSSQSLQNDSLSTSLNRTLRDRSKLATKEEMHEQRCQLYPTRLIHSSKARESMIEELSRSVNRSTKKINPKITPTSAELSKDLKSKSQKVNQSIFNKETTKKTNPKITPTSPELSKDLTSKSVTGSVKSISQKVSQSVLNKEPMSLPRKGRKLAKRPTVPIPADIEVHDTNLNADIVQDDWELHAPTPSVKKINKSRQKKQVKDDRISSDINEPGPSGVSAPEKKKSGKVQKSRGNKEDAHSEINAQTSDPQEMFLWCPAGQTRNMSNITAYDIIWQAAVDLQQEISDTADSEISKGLVKKVFNGFRRNLKPMIFQELQLQSLEKDVREKRKTCKILSEKVAEANNEITNLQREVTALEKESDRSLYDINQWIEGFQRLSQFCINSSSTT